MRIKSIEAREIIDSRATPTIEVKVTLKNGVSAKASVPSGASTGTHEAWELRDGDKKRYDGKGVLTAVKNVNQRISKVLLGREVTKQREIDNIMIALDGTLNRSRLGANAILGVSLACARVGSIGKKWPLYAYLRHVYGSPNQKYQMPVPMFNIFNGGKHADNHLDVQELMVIPMGMKRFSERVRAGYEIFSSLGLVLRDAMLNTNVGNEGGYASEVKTFEEALDCVVDAIKKAGYKPGQNVWLGTDIGSSEFYDRAKKVYTFRMYDGKSLNETEMLEWYQNLCKNYPFLSLEDPFDQDEWESWTAITKEMGGKHILVGDDLFVTNVSRLKKGIEMKVANAILIKVNQIGTLSETMDCIQLAQKSAYKVVISHRSGETTDDFIADLACAVNADFVKMGATRGERACKYNRIMEIEEEVRKAAFETVEK